MGWGVLNVGAGLVPALLGDHKGRLYIGSLCLHFLIVIPAPRLRGGRLRESTLVNKMDTRLRGYDTTSGEVEICKDSDPFSW